MRLVQRNVDTSKFKEDEGDCYTCGKSDMKSGIQGKTKFYLCQVCGTLYETEAPVKAEKTE